MQAFRFVFLDGLQEVGIRVKQLPLVLPIVPRRKKQAAVLGQHRLHPPQSRKQVGHLETQGLQAARPRTERGREREAGTRTKNRRLHMPCSPARVGPLARVCLSTVQAAESDPKSELVAKAKLTLPVFGLWEDAAIPEPPQLGRGPCCCTAEIIPVRVDVVPDLFQQAESSAQGGPKNIHRHQTAVPRGHGCLHQHLLDVGHRRAPVLQDTDPQTC